MNRFMCPRIAAIGGGTGLSTMLRGLKNCHADITAVVAVTDDGGGSGVLRRELGMLPPGDIRNCILALANAEPAMEQLMNYRFTEGSLAGQSLGNLVLAAFNELSPSFDKAVETMSQVLAITGRVLPVTNANLVLRARFDNGETISGETSITDYKNKSDALIRRMELAPAGAKALPAVLEAIDRADMIVLGPGSLYTSVLPNLLVGGVAEHICRSKALKIYVLNVMTQDGETERFTAADHVRTLFEQSGAKLFDWVLANSAPVPPDAIQSYSGENAAPVAVDDEALTALGVSVLRAEVSGMKGRFVRHDPQALAAALMDFYRRNATTRVFG